MFNSPDRNGTRRRRDVSRHHLKLSKTVARPGRKQSPGPMNKFDKFNEYNYYRFVYKCGNDDDTAYSRVTSTKRYSNRSRGPSAKRDLSDYITAAVKSKISAATRCVHNSIPLRSLSSRFSGLYSHSTHYTITHG